MQIQGTARNTIGRLPLDQAEAFLFHNPTARAGSLTADGMRRLYTHEDGSELLRLIGCANDCAVVATRPKWKNLSTSVIAPGIKDLAFREHGQFHCEGEFADHPSVINEFKSILEKMVGERGYEFPPVPKLNGDGIVIVGGGRYWLGIAVSIRMLRESGCNLPVEVWYRGNVEPVTPSDVLDCGEVRFVDTCAHAVARGGARMLGGWESKVWAMANTKFNRILFLDADAYCLEDPTGLIESLEGSEPFQYWEDAPKQSDSIRWDKVWPKSKKTVPAVQGGQLLIDRSRCWKFLCLIQWMNQYSDFYYQHMFGDQDTYRVALEAIGDRSLWKCLSPVEDTRKVMIASHDGKPFIVHRIGSKLFPVQWREGNGQVWDGVPDLTIPGESRMAAKFAAICAQ